nr:CzcE family metal-binding protein [Cupriavidus sp. SK-3]
MAPTPAQFGHPAPVATASRTITLTSRVKYHVYSGETVAFRIGYKMVSWTFAVDAVGGGRSVDMSSIFPDLPEAKGVVVFIERSNLYRAG